MSDRAELRGLTGGPGSRLATLLGAGLEPVAPLRGIGGCLERIAIESSPPSVGAEAARRGLPDGAALPEAMAIRLRSAGLEPLWAESVAVRSVRELLDLCRARGRSSVEIARADPRLLSELQLGAWFDAPWRTRAIRRAPRWARSALRPLALSSRRWLTAVADLAFWDGVREAATPAEWRRWTRSSYATLVYHRFAGEGKPGQERIDVAPRRFSRQLRALRLAGFSPVPAERLLAFHLEEDPELPRRGVSITVDDAIVDCLAPLRRHASWCPQLFVPTAEVGGRAHWMDGEPVASWDEIRKLADAGISIGSHARHHQRLTRLDGAHRSQELKGSLADLRANLDNPLEVLAYPNGDHDAASCRASREAGYRAAFTTEKGRNGAGTDPFCLRRVSVHAADGAPAVLWKALTGEALPEPWLRLRNLLRRRRYT